jgi:hypothetical protein
MELSTPWMWMASCTEEFNNVARTIGIYYPVLGSSTLNSIPHVEGSVAEVEEGPAVHLSSWTNNTGHVSEDVCDKYTAMWVFMDRNH